MSISLVCRRGGDAEISIQYAATAHRRSPNILIPCSSTSEVRRWLSHFENQLGDGDHLECAALQRSTLESMRRKQWAQTRLWIQDVQYVELGPNGHVRVALV